MTKPSERQVSGKSVHELIAEVDTGGRNPVGAIPKNVLFFVPLAWTFFQLWHASPLPYLFDFFILNSTEARSIHLAFAMFLAYTAFPTFKSSPKNYIPLQDWVLALIASGSAAYIFIFYTELSSRPGAPLLIDLIVAVIGLILLLEATRRALGPPLMVVAAVFMVYAFAGAHMPDVIAHKGASLTKGMTHYWLTTEGSLRCGARSVHRYGVYVRAFRLLARGGRGRETTSSKPLLPALATCAAGRPRQPSFPRR